MASEFGYEVMPPMMLAKELWPNVTFYDRQREIIESCETCHETVVVAGNQLGKDFVAGFIVLAAFLRHPVVRIVTTSVADDHLRVLWGEIGRFIQTSKRPLDIKNGGPLFINHREIRKAKANEEKIPGIQLPQCKISYLIGQVSERGEKMAGHHAPFTMGVIDEASGVDNQVYTQMTTWAKRILCFGNPNECNAAHFFKKAVKEGDILAK